MITNPVSGKMPVEKKRSLLAEAADVLDTEIHGLDTRTREEFGACARDLASRFDVVVAAGGDGTFSDVLNAIGASEAILGYLPLGTGNALGHALGYAGGLAGIARRIKTGSVREYDLIDCDGRLRAITASIGFDGMVIRLRDRYVAAGGAGFTAYLRAAFNAYFSEYRRVTARITLDGNEVEVRDLLTLIAVKEPFYGFRMKVVPKARFDDGRLHVRWVNSGLFGSAVGAVSAFIVGNPVGPYRTGQNMEVRLDRPVMLQADGNQGWEADCFSFRVLPKALRIKC